jgi:Kef-type K+ transport system membrane component KefB
MAGGRPFLRAARRKGASTMDFLPELPLQATPLIMFDLLLILGAAGGYLAHRITWLPSITGFMVIGCLAGPSGLGLLTAEKMCDSRILIDIALALILYRLGLSLDLRQLWRHPRLAAVSALESGATFVVVLSVSRLFGVPWVVAALVAAIASSSSPAVLRHVAHEVDAKGPVTESATTLVALNNCLAYVTFSAILPFLHYTAGSDWAVILLQPLYRFLGSVALSVAVGVGVHQMVLRTRDAAQYRLAIVIGAAMLSAGLARELNLSSLLCALVLGVAVSSLEREKLLSSIEFGSAFELFFIILFVYAGAGLHLRELVAFWPVVLVLVVSRSLAKVLAVAAAFSLFGEPPRRAVTPGMLLVPMAGLAIGLVQTVARLFPQYADTVTAIILGAVTLFEAVGPLVAKAAFRLCGEAAEARAGGAPR